MIQGGTPYFGCLKVFQKIKAKKEPYIFHEMEQKLIREFTIFFIYI